MKKLSTTDAAEFNGDLTSLLRTPSPIGLSTAGLRKGIDNYRVDVELSPKFVSCLDKTIALLLNRALMGRAALPSRDSVFNDIKASYREMIKHLVHRAKADLNPQQVHFLHYAVIKFTLQESRAALDDVIESLKTSASNMQVVGSGKLLDKHSKVVWLTKSRPAILYQLNHQLFRILHKVDSAQLREDRLQALGIEQPQYLQILFNDLLCAREPTQDDLLLNHYALWEDSGRDVFTVNQVWEKLLQDNPLLPAVEPLKTIHSGVLTNTEVFDELGGLFEVQALLGAAQDQKEKLQESFSWMEHTAGIQALFDRSADDERIEQLRAQGEEKLAEEYRDQRKRLEKLLDAFTSRLRRSNRLVEIAASYQMRLLWSQEFADILDPPQLRDVIAGTATRAVRQKLAELLDEFPVLKNQVRDVQAKVKSQLKEHPRALTLQVLCDIARYRLHLKYFRFAQRAFNRIAVLESRDDLKLSSKSGQLHQLRAESEVEEAESRVLRHTIIKADVRGSTTVTAQLAEKGLNPASYFSTRFFGPINKLLETYDAGKVFIEGDAVILSLMEYSDKPQQWFSVARAAGLSREIIQVVIASNSHTTRMGLPSLEVGIGICHEDAPPQWLMDGENPIMISAGISDADRLSGCSWKLREQHTPDAFNVEVCEIAGEVGEKGQQDMRYNVNGILLGDVAFRKLRAEVWLEKVALKIDGARVVFYLGEFPDMEGKHRGLVIREAPVRLWQEDKVADHRQPSRVFYEVVSNRKIIAHVRNRYKMRKAAS